MSMSYEDIMMEEAFSAMHDEAVMKAATLAQCIYLFVEGDSEEQAFPILLKKSGLNLEEIGIVIANYNGIGNLKHALRLLSKTLSHDRPIVVTFDNDESGKRISSAISNLDINDELVSVVTVPKNPVVSFSSGHKGGSFEEAFNSHDFVTTCFLKGIMDDALLSKRTEFEKIFNPINPWYSQVAQFCHNHGEKKFISRKVKLAVELAASCNTIPETFIHLAELLTEVRAKHPVKHPDNVELPKVHGLTY